MIPEGQIEQTILLVRGQKIILDSAVEIFLSSPLGIEQSLQKDNSLQNRLKKVNN